MDNKRDLTRELLANCFHDLLLTVPFDKITIKMITDQAGLIRPTFYKHFQDKYEVLEWIFKTDVTDNVDMMLKNGMEIDAVVMFCRLLDKDRKFYRRAYQMDPGPNSFDNILSRYVYNTFLELGDRFEIRTDRQYPFLTREMIATYYTNGLVHTIRDWIVSDSSMSAEDLASAYRYLLSHSVLDIIASSD